MSGRPPEPKAQQQGYLVVLRPDATPPEFITELERWSPADIAGWSRFLDDLRHVDPARYAGWDRDPVGRAFSAREIAAWPKNRAELVSFLGFGSEFVPEALDGPFSQAEHLMTERLGEDPNTCWQVRFVSERVIPDPAIASEVLSLTADSAQREIIHLTRIEDSADDDACASDDARTSRRLGFDVGSWGGPFSLISDTMIYPRWHPGPDEVMPVLREYAATLNKHMLFSTASAAMAFRAWYRSQTWGETEDEEGDYCVTRIDRA